MGQKFVPVVSSTGKPLMPTTNKKADQLLAKGRAVRRFDRGLFYIKLLDRADGYTQGIVLGIDPGSKKEGLTLKSEKHTLLNLQADAVTWVSEAEETSTTLRKTRRSRQTPYRPMRVNRNQGWDRLPPSTRARWGWKLRLVTWLMRYYPIKVFIVEDIATRTRQGKSGKWNKSFSPLEVGKHWFYAELEKRGRLETKQGHETADFRISLNLKKSKNKMSDSFDAHCVDSWVLANSWFDGRTQPDNTAVLFIVPLRFHRRQLHRLQPVQGGKRSNYGGTKSMGFKRGSWVKHPKYGVCYVGRSSNERMGLHDIQTGKRLTVHAKPTDLKFLCTASWRIRKGDSAIPPHA